MPLEGEYAPGAIDWSRTEAEDYVASGGQSAAHFRVPIVVLTTLGARSKMLRRTAVVRVTDGADYAAVASFGGRPQHPAWFRNILAHPIVELQDGEENGDYSAVVLAGADRDKWWDRAVSVYSEYATYQETTTRLIPVVLLRRI